MQSEKSEKKCTTVASLIHSWIAQRRLLCNKTGEKNSRQLFFYIASWSHFFCHGSVNTAKQGGDGFLICCFSVAVWKHDNRSSGHAFLYVRTARILKCLWHEKYFLLIWKAFENTEWHFSFWNIFFRFRDINILLLCKLDQWWRHFVCT